MSRPNGRSVDQLREVKIERNFTIHAEGSVLVSFGNTKVLCNASFTPGVPRFKKDSGEGWVTAEYAMLPRATHDRSDREAVKGKIGDDSSRWTIKEVGDGNLNLVFIVTGETGAVIVKQALPYVRLVGESWPLPLSRGSKKSALPMKRLNRPRLKTPNLPKPKKKLIPKTKQPRQRVPRKPRPANNAQPMR